MGRTVAVALLLLGALALRPPAALAQAPDPQQTAAARALFQEGLALVQQHSWPEAVDRFRRVLALRASAAVRLNLGLALIQVGKLVEASELLRDAAQDASAPEAVRHQASTAASQLDARIGRITIHVEGQSAGDDVAFDGRVVSPATLGVAVPADPGPGTVTLFHDGHVVATQTVNVPEGGAAEVTLAPTLAVTQVDAAPAPAVVAAASTHEPALYEQWWFWAAVGGVVAVAIVIALVAVATSGTAAPVTGNFDPGVLNVQVMP